MTRPFAFSQHSDKTLKIPNDPSLAGLTPQEWLSRLFPRAFSAPLSPYQAQFWNWIWNITASVYSAPFVAIWPRGAGKSTSGEASCVAVGARQTREYAIYVSGTQSQADKHIESIGAMLESLEIEAGYPSLGSRGVGKYGASKGWRRNRLSTAQGFTVDALGLDTAMRGIKLESQRPDFIILDDIDSAQDSLDVIERKKLILTRDILPARSDHCAVLAVQNLIHGGSIFSQLAIPHQDGGADFLADRTISGPYPSLIDMAYEFQDGQAVLTAGTPTWDYKDLAACQREVITIGIRAFLVECQQVVEAAGNPRFNMEAVAVHKTRIHEPLPESALPPEMRGLKGLRVYELPIPGEPYVAYADCAEGLRQDYTATGIGRARTGGSMILLLEDNDRDPGIHAAIMVQLLRLYNTPLLGVERAKGENYFYVLGREGYSRLYEHPLDQSAAQRNAGAEPTSRRGFPMTAATKKGLIDEFSIALETYAFTSPDARLWDQVANYVTLADNKTAARAGYHDDLVYVAAGLVRMSRQPGATSMRQTTPKVVNTTYKYSNPRR